MRNNFAWLYVVKIFPQQRLLNLKTDIYFLNVNIVIIKKFLFAIFYSNT